MKKKYFFYSITILIISVTIFFVWYLNRINLVAIESTIIEPIETPANHEQSITVPLVLVASKPGQEQIAVKNFLVANTVEMYDENTSRIAHEKTSVGTVWYEIFYFQNDRSIVVSLQAEPLITARAIAENELVEKLGITKEDLCKLVIRVSVPVAVSTKFAGQDLGISSCAGSLQI